MLTNHEDPNFVADRKNQLNNFIVAVASDGVMVDATFVQSFLGFPKTTNVSSQLFVTSNTVLTFECGAGQGNKFCVLYAVAGDRDNVKVIHSGRWQECDCCGKSFLGFLAATDSVHLPRFAG
jgi:hypothetical protein